MSLTIGLQIGRAIFYILKSNLSVQGVTGMDESHIQPAPLKERASAITALTYQIDAVNPVNVKRTDRTETATLYLVDFTCECIAKDYSICNDLAMKVSRAFQESPNGTYNTIKLNGITLSSASEDYNKARKYYSNSLSFQARVLL
tara:strand:- start:12059 stop:12493 length:435 start_codon:yes stop_codon:yes gene_type:complete